MEQDQDVKGMDNAISTECGRPTNCGISVAPVILSVAVSWKELIQASRAFVTAKLDVVLI